MSNKQELIGIIKNKKIDRVRNKKSEHFGNQYYRLQVKIENSEIKEILVFKEWVEQENVWEDVEKWELKDYYNQKYLFRIQRKPGAGQFFRLLSWEMLNDVQTFDKEILEPKKNHGSN